MMSSAEDQVLEVLAAVSKRERSTLAPEQHLSRDLGIDSARGLDLLGQLDDKLGIYIPDENAALMNTVGDILAYVREQEKELPGVRGQGPDAPV